MKKKTYKEKLEILKDLNSGYLVQFVKNKYQISTREFYNTFQRTYRGDWEFKGKAALPLKFAELEALINGLDVDSAIIALLLARIFELKELSK